MVRKTVFISGGTGKIGSVLVKSFLEKGDNVVITATRKESLQNLLEKIPERNHNSLFSVIVDFNDSDSLQKIDDFLTSHDLAPHIIIHNARSINSLGIGESGITRSEDLLTEFNMAVVFPYALTNLIMDKGQLENVIFVSSMYGVVAPTPSLYDDFKTSSPIQYGVAKSAQIHMAKEMAVRYAPDVRVNCVSFGGIKGRVDALFEKRYNELTPLGRMLEVEDVVKPVLFLASEGSKDMTGHNLIVDGGWTVW